MTYYWAILAAVLAIAAIVFTIRLAPGRTETVPRGGQRSEGSGREPPAGPRRLISPGQRQRQLRAG